MDTDQQVEAEPGTAGGGPPGGGSVWVRAGASFEAWVGGDSSALDDLVRLLSPVLWHIARSYGLDRQTAEDVVQTTWLSLLGHREQIQQPRAVGGWLTISARREAWRVARGQSRTSALDDEDLQWRLDTADSAESAALGHRDRRQLWAAVTQLSERCQRLLRVIAFSDRPDYASLARDLGMPTGSIGPTRGRCLAKLHTLLTPQSPADPTTGAHHA